MGIVSSTEHFVDTGSIIVLMSVVHRVFVEAFNNNPKPLLDFFLCYPILCYIFWLPIAIQRINCSFA